MTISIFSDQEGTIAENCCLVMETCIGCPRHPVDFHKHAYGGGHQMTHFLKAGLSWYLALLCQVTLTEQCLWVLFKCRCAPPMVITMDEPGLVPAGSLPEN